MRLPTDSEIAEINAKHLIDTPLKPADLLFVFGTREDVALRADTAVRLWREGLFRWAIVSGGVTPGSKLSECEIIKAAMVARGMPAERILEEHRSTNTGENVVFSLPIIDTALGLEGPQRDLPRQQLDRAALSDDAAAALAGSREDADRGRRLRRAAIALAHRRRIPPPGAVGMRQDRAVYGEGIHRGVAGVRHCTPDAARAPHPSLPA
jgi:DUF218 domain